MIYKTPVKRDNFLKTLMALGLKKNQAQLAMESFFSTILDGLKAGKKVTIVGLGTWQWKTRVSRETRNPKTGKVIHLQSHKVLSFTPTPAFKKKLNVFTSS
jgi:DNA-binding protein HU-beta